MADKKFNPSFAPNNTKCISLDGIRREIVVSDHWTEREFEAAVVAAKRNEQAQLELVTKEK